MRFERGAAVGQQELARDRTLRGILPAFGFSRACCLDGIIGAITGRTRLLLTVLMALLALMALLGAGPAWATGPVADGANQVYADSDGTIAVIDSSTMQVTTRLGGGSTLDPTPNGMVASPDGSHIYVATGGGVNVIDTATDTESTTALATAPELFAVAVAVSPDGKDIYAMGRGNMFAEWDASTGALLREFPLTTLSGYVSYSIAVGSDGTAYVGTTAPNGDQFPGLTAVPAGATSFPNYTGLSTVAGNQLPPAIIGPGGVPFGILTPFGAGWITDMSSDSNENEITQDAAGTGDAVGGLGILGVNDMVAYDGTIYATGNGNQALVPGASDVSGAGSGGFAITADTAGGSDEGTLYIGGTSVVEKRTTGFALEGSVNPDSGNGDYDAIAVGGPYLPQEVSITAGNPVNEPASGTAPQTFTVSIPQPVGAPTVVGYKTIDGTATAADNNYTPTTTGSVTIPDGATSATITVPVDDGNGATTTAALSYQVELTSSTGPMVSTTNNIATGTIEIPEIMGRVTDQNGNPLPGAQIVMSGTAASGQTVLRQATSTMTGTYAIYADPGSYDVDATPPSSTPGALDPAPCSDATVTTTEAGSTIQECLLTLGPGADQTVNFTQGKLLVENITFQQLNADSDELETVGPAGTIDGNRVQVTATIENVGDTDQTTDVQFGSPIDNSATVGATVSNVAVPAGTSVKVDQILDTAGLAWDDSGQPDVERRIMITLTNGASHLEQTLGVEPKPVILVHGLFSNATTWDAYINGSAVTDLAGGVRAHKAGGGFLSSVTPGWRGFAVGDGQAPGVMDTSPFEHPGNTIAQNAFQLATYINGVRKLTDAQHVDIVAHSLGGLISRYYIQELMPEALPGDSRPVVDHLVEMGTPNLGSNCAYLALAASAPIALTPSSAAGPDINEPLYQLTPSYLSLFNQQITQARGVAFSIMAGNGFFGVSCTGVGPNDGVVSVPNAEWNIANPDVEHLVHTSMTSSATAFSRYVAPHLEIGPGVIGGGTYSTGTLSGGPASQRRVADQALSDVIAAPASSLPDGSPSTPNLCLTTSAVDSLSGGGTAKLKKTGAVSDAIAVPAGAGSISVTVLAAPNVTTDLVGPSGRIGQAIVAGTPAATGLFRTLKVTSPKAGIWHLRSSQADGDAPTQLSLSVSFKHPSIQAALTIHQAHYAKAGSKLRFTVHVTTRRRTRGSPTVSVQLETAGGGTDTLRLRHLVGANYTAVSAPLSAIPSVADVRVVQGGALSGRSWSIATATCGKRR